MNKLETIATYSAVIHEARRCNRPVSFPYMVDGRQYTAVVTHLWDEERVDRFQLTGEVNQVGDPNGYIFSAHTAQAVAEEVWNLQTGLRASLSTTRFLNDSLANIAAVEDTNLMPVGEDTPSSHYLLDEFVDVEEEPVTREPAVTIENITETTDPSFNGVRSFSVTVNLLSNDGRVQRHTLTYPSQEQQDFPNSDSSPEGTVYVHPEDDVAYVLQRGLWRAVPNEVFDVVDLNPYLQTAPNVWLPTHNSEPILREDGGLVRTPPALDTRPRVVQEAYPNNDANYPGLDSGGNDRNPFYRCAMCRGCNNIADTNYINCAIHPLGPENETSCPDYEPKVSESDLWEDVPENEGLVTGIQIPDAYYDSYGRAYDVVPQLPNTNEATPGDRVVVYGVPYIFNYGQWHELSHINVSDLRRTTGPTVPIPGQLFSHGDTVYEWDVDSWTYATGYFIRRETGLERVTEGHELFGYRSPLEGVVIEYDDGRWVLHGQIWRPLAVGSTMLMQDGMYVWDGSEMRKIFATDRPNNCGND